MRCTRRFFGITALTGISSLAGCSDFPSLQKSNPVQAGGVIVENNHSFPHVVAIRVTRAPANEPIAGTFSHTSFTIQSHKRKAVHEFLRWEGTYIVECRLLSGASKTSMKITLQKRDGKIRGENISFKIGSGGQLTSSKVMALE